MDRPAEGATVVLRGRVELTDGDSGWEAGPGTLLDELALLTRRRHAFGAFALTDVEVLPVERTLFRRLVEEYPDIAARVRARIAGRLAALAEEMEPVVRRMEEADRLLDRGREGRG